MGEIMKVLLLVLTLSLALGAQADYLVKGVRLSAPLKDSWKTESIQKVPGKRTKPEILRSLPKFVGEFAGFNGGLYEEIIFPEDQLPAEMKISRILGDETEASADAEVRVIFQQGPWKNRINFTIVGDGYLASEKEKFFLDSKRIADELFKAKTFSSYAPLFNVSAVFVASRVSGVGDGAPMDTAFKLYRTPKGSKRAIYPGDERALDAAIAKAPATSYPIVIANDNYYGGLGGKYSISTSSVRSGLIVLRHELGHSIGEVGEEYDDAQTYYGANSTIYPQTTWQHWASGKIEINEAKILGGKYVWKDLATGPENMAFKTQGLPGELLGIDLSSVGWESPQDVEVSFDNKVIRYDGNFSEDRNFFFVGPVAGIAPGNHNLKIEEKIKDGNNTLGFARIYSYPANYNFTKHVIGAFATYNEFGQKTYRPTHDSCLMRNMQVEYFCVVDQENLWMKMLPKVRLIDSLTKSTLSNGRTGIKLETISLPLSIQWTKISSSGNQILTDLKDQKNFEIELRSGESLKADVEFATSEVRKRKFTDTATIK